MNPAFLALSRLRRRRYDECINLCTGLLEKNHYDQQAWWIKMRGLTLKSYVDDTGAQRLMTVAKCPDCVHTAQASLFFPCLVEMEEEGIAEILMDDNAMQAAPRPGTSLNRPGTQARPTSAMRPMVRLSALPQRAVHTSAFVRCTVRLCCCSSQEARLSGVGFVLERPLSLVPCRQAAGGLSPVSRDQGRRQAVRRQAIARAR